METNSSKALGLITLILLAIAIALFSYTSLLWRYGKIQDSSSLAQLNFMELSSLVRQPDLGEVALLLGVRDLKTALPSDESIYLNRQEQLVISNNNPYWFSKISEPIVTNGPFKVLLNFNTQYTNSELILVGQSNSPTDEWWEGIRELRVGYNNEHKGYYLRLLNGLQENSCWYEILKDTTPSDSIILEFANALGQVLTVRDTAGEILGEVNLLEKKDLQMESGLFPYSTLRVGVSVEPKVGKIVISKMYLYLLKSKQSND